LVGLAIGAWSISGFACRTEAVVLFELPAEEIDPSGGGSAGLEPGGTAGNPLPTGGNASTGGWAFGGNAPSGGRQSSSGGADAEGEPCSADDDCPASWFCQMPDCSATSGVCMRRPIFCPPEPRPVCGCSELSYWNECLRQQAGERSQRFGECAEQARSCDTAADCGASGAFCAKLDPRDDRCGPDDRGTCWVMPDDCGSGDPMRWVECAPQEPSGMPPVCVDTCTAIRSERPYFRAPRRAPCDMPP
jgi:hypothetical protein